MVSKAAASERGRRFGSARLSVPKCNMPNTGKTFFASSRNCVRCQRNIVNSSTSPRPHVVGPDSKLSRLDLAYHRVGAPEKGRREKEGNMGCHPGG